MASETGVAFVDLRAAYTAFETMANASSTRHQVRPTLSPLSRPEYLALVLGYPRVAMAMTFWRTLFVHYLDTAPVDLAACWDLDLRRRSPLTRWRQVAGGNARWWAPGCAQDGRRWRL